MPRFDLFFIRHGHSCANLSRELDYPGLLHDIAPNAPLDLLGMKQASHLHDLLQTPPPQEAGYYPLYDLNKVDLVVSSELLRAIETAQLIFQGRKDPIEIIPYMSEVRFFLVEQLNLDPENRADTPHITQSKLKILKRAFPQWFKNTPPIQYELRGDIKTPTHSNHEDFFSFLPTIFRYVIRKKPRQKQYRIAFVTHGRFMEQLLFEKPIPLGRDVICEPPHDEYRMPNTAVWLRVVSWDEEEGLRLYHQQLLYPVLRDPMCMKLSKNLVFKITNADHPEYVAEIKKMFCQAQNVVYGNRNGQESLLAPCGLFYDMAPLMKLCSTRRMLY